VTALEPFCETIKIKDPYENIAGKTTSGWGDMEKGFAGSDYLREDRFGKHLSTLLVYGAAGCRSQLRFY
jgi:hypothetical protein